ITLHTDWTIRYDEGVLVKPPGCERHFVEDLCFLLLDVTEDLGLIIPPRLKTKRKQYTESFVAPACKESHRQHMAFRSSSAACELEESAMLHVSSDGCFAKHFKRVAKSMVGFDDLPLLRDVAI